MLRSILLVLILHPAARGAEFKGESCSRCHVGIRDAAPRARLDAGVDTEMPCIEGAIVSGMRAAGEARKLAAK